MKKILSIMLALVMVLAIAPVSVFAEDDILSYLTYEINNGEVTITDCDESISGEVVLPDTIEGYPVTAIGNDVFGGCSYITSIIIPEGVTSIGNWAISSCVSLKTIVLPESLTYIDYSAFAYNFSIESVTIPSGIKVVPGSSFVGNLYLSEINFPDNLDLIECGFDWCPSLKSVVIPTGTKEVEGYAFAWCPFMKEVYIYEPDVILGECSFGYMTMEVLTDYDTYMSLVDIFLDDMYNDNDDSESYDNIENYHNYYDYDDAKKIDGFVIHGYAGSTAEAYALENGFEFVELCEHNYISEVVKEPTSTETGIKADVCEHCGDVINEEEIPMLENDEDVSEEINTPEVPETPEDSENDDDSASLSIIEKIMQFFQKIVDFLKNLFSF